MHYFVKLSFSICFFLLLVKLINLFRKSYKYVQRQRIFPKSQNLAASHHDLKMENKNILSNMRVGFLGRLGITQSDATKIVEELDGVVSKKKCDPDLTFVISTEGNFKICIGSLCSCKCVSIFMKLNSTSRNLKQAFIKRSKYLLCLKKFWRD